MLGTEGSLGGMLGLDARWAVRAITAEGNFAEIFDKYLGAGSLLGLPRGLNALYKDGRHPILAPVPLASKMYRPRPPSTTLRSATPHRATRSRARSHETCGMI